MISNIIILKIALVRLLLTMTSEIGMMASSWTDHLQICLDLLEERRR